jgi:uncharacterized alkaline shock family protein YloU
MVTRHLQRTSETVAEPAREEVTLRPAVVARIAGMAAQEVEDVALASMPGLVPLVFGAFPDSGTRVRRAVKASLSGKRADVHIWLKVAYGRPIPEVVTELRQNIRRRLGELAEVRDVRISIHVTDMLLPPAEGEA